MNSKVIKKQNSKSPNLAAFYDSDCEQKKSTKKSGKLDQEWRKDSSKTVKCIEIDDFLKCAAVLMGTKTELVKWRDFVYWSSNGSSNNEKELKRIADEAVMNIVASI